MAAGLHMDAGCTRYHAWKPTANGAEYVPARKREESEPSSEAGFASKMVCS